jgi:hypothetical protein
LNQFREIAVLRGNSEVISRKTAPFWAYTIPNSLIWCCWLRDVSSSSFCRLTGKDYWGKRIIPISPGKRWFTQSGISGQTSALDTLLGQNYLNLRQNLRNLRFTAPDSGHYRSDSVESIDLVEKICFN